MLVEKFKITSLSYILIIAVVCLPFILLSQTQAVLTADLDGDYTVGESDLDILISYWMDTNCAVSADCQGADLEPVGNPDGDVDVADVGEFARQWQMVEIPPTTMDVTTVIDSDGDLDGRVWDNAGGTVAAGADSADADGDALRLGDVYNSAMYSYKSVLSFDTSWIPDGAEILDVTLQLTRGELIGVDPFLWPSSPQCLVDIAKPYLGIDETLETNEWYSDPNAYAVAQFTADPGDELPMISTSFNAEGRGFINKTGKTQFMVRMSVHDSGSGSNYLGFYSGENAIAANRPKLTITYRTTQLLIAYESLPEDGRVWSNTLGTGTPGLDDGDTGDIALRLGDGLPDGTLYGYKSIVSFDLATPPAGAPVIPPGATVAGAQLWLMRGSISNTNPFVTGFGGTCRIDLANPYFGLTSALAISDWDDTATEMDVAQILPEAVGAADTQVFSTDFNAAGLSAINASGITQLRFYFENEDCGAGGASGYTINYIGFYSADDLTAFNRPKLIVYYQLP